MKMPKTMGELNVFFISSPGPAVALLTLIISVFLQWQLGSPWYLLTVAAVFGRSLSEWLLHRYVWHVPEIKLASIRISNPIARLHAQHHLNPDEPSGVLFGGRMVTLLFILIALSGMAFLSFQGTLAALTVASVMLLLYEWCHLLAHSNVVPRSSFLRKLADQHRYHHINQESCFAVSQVWADKLFGTSASVEQEDGGS